MEQLLSKFRFRQAIDIAAGDEEIGRFPGALANENADDENQREENGDDGDQQAKEISPLPAGSGRALDRASSVTPYGGRYSGRDVYRGSQERICRATRSALGGPKLDMTAIR